MMERGLTGDVALIIDGRATKANPTMMYVERRPKEMTRSFVAKVGRGDRDDIGWSSVTLVVSISYSTSLLE